MASPLFLVGVQEPASGEKIIPDQTPVSIGLPGDPAQAAWLVYPGNFPCKKRAELLQIFSFQERT